LRSATCERGKLRKVEGTRRSFRSLTDDLEVSIQPHCETLARVFCRESVRESEESSKKQKVRAQHRSRGCLRGHDRRRSPLCSRTEGLRGRVTTRCPRRARYLFQNGFFLRLLFPSLLSLIPIAHSESRLFFLPSSSSSLHPLVVQVSPSTPSQQRR